jgi:L-ascorbate metabolism protein UlaG (beta-lactamase superfamily)
MNLTYLGHACFLLETSKARILFDPFINPNSIVQETRKSSLNKEIVGKLDSEKIECNYVLVSHGHEDHIADAESILKRTGARLVSNFEIVSWFGEKGISNGHPMNHGGSWNFDFGKIKYVTAVHSSLLPDGSYGGNPGGFIIEADSKTIYYAGDTALTYDMKLIGEEFNLASKAASFIGCNNIIGMHYDTFGYIEVDHSAVQEEFANNGQSITLMSIGETKEI